MELRPYQIETIERLRETLKALLRAKRPARALVQLPTGAGKTVVASHVMQGAYALGTPTLFVAHRSELIYQTSSKLTAFGVDHGLIIPGEPRPVGKSILVGTIQSVTARSKRGKSDYDDLKLIFIDEAHRTAARTYTDLLDAWPNAHVIGLTATPCRGDGRGLGDIYEELVQGPTIQDLTDMGHLVPVRYFAPETYDLAGVRTRGGDYREDDLDEAVNKDILIGNIVEHHQRIAANRQTVVFATSVAHSRGITERFNQCGIPAGHIDGDTPMDERKQTLEDLRIGKLRVVSNCAILTEGWDQPSVSCIVLARPTKSIGLYLQIAGRALRPSPGKTDCVVIDHTGTVNRLGSITDYHGWTLSTKQGEAVSRNKPKTAKQPKPCPSCSQLIEPARICPNCGHVFDLYEPKEPPHETDGELVEITGLGKAKGKTQGYSLSEKEAWYAQFRGYADEKGYKSGWAYHQYRAKFGTKPPSYMDPDPIHCEATVRSWIISQQIRNRKSQYGSNQGKGGAWWNR